MNDRTDRTRDALTRSELIGGASAGVCLAAAGWIALDGGPRSTAAAVILGTAALALAGLCLGRPLAIPRRGPASDREEAGTGDEPAAGGEDGEDAGAVASARRPLSLAERLGLGPLGGLVGGATVALAVWILAGLGIDGLLGVDLSADGGVPGFGRRLWTGAVWGLALGAFYRRMPGGSAVSRGVIFSMIPATWALLVEYPLFRGQGIAGVELGALTFVVVILLHLLWGGVTGALFQWAELTSEGALDRPLGAVSP